MALPNGSGGYQLGSGNLTEPTLGYTAAPLSQAATATLSTAQVLANILLVGNGQTAAQTFTLPTASAIDTALPSARAGHTFSLYMVNLGTSSGTAALALGTGITDGGNATVALPVTSSAEFWFRKTGDGAWVAYKVA